MNTHLLIVDDDDDILAAAKLVLRKQFTRFSVSPSPDAIPEIMASDHVDVVLLDMNFGPGESDGAEGLKWIRYLSRHFPESVVLSATAHGGVNIAVQAMKEGATDFIIKPWQNEKLIATVNSALTLSLSRRKAQQLQNSNQALVAASSHSDHDLLGNSGPMQHVKKLIKKAAPTDANVLILGENGTGKELAARAVHAESHRHDRVFISVDLGALPENLFESELFGHKKGAFTGAHTERVGRFEAADGGTLFLDEIGNLSLAMQSKLLTALEQRKVTPIGDHRSVDIDVRIVAATNLDMDKLQDETYFRQDLLYRLNTVEIKMPPLRDRAQDIEEIARFYLRMYTKKYNKSVNDFDTQAMVAIQHYSWPGNVRALRHAIERAVILCEESFITATDMQLKPEKTDDALDKKPSSQQNLDNLNLDNLEKTAVATALNRHGYNISRAAKDLGITRAALYRRMEKYDL